MSADPAVVAAIVGPPGHGVVRHARTIAGLTESAVVGVDADRGGPIAASAGVVVHVHYTDRLFGPDAAAAAERFLRLTAPVGDRLVLTLHDVPAADGSGHAERRATAYRALASAAAAVVVSSRHERDRLVRLGVRRPIDVIPLPIVRRPTGPSRDPRRSSRPTVAVLGFVYPGKGHDAVIDAVAGLDVRLLAIGAPSPGHDDLVGELGRRAAARRCALQLTGPVDDRRLDVILGRVAVPVAPAVAPSASASLARWIGAGRRPLAAASAYTDEVAAVDDDLLIRYEPDSLGAAIAQALDAPASTYRSGPIPAAFCPATVGRLHRSVYERVAAGASHG